MTDITPAIETIDKLISKQLEAIDTLTEMKKSLLQKLQTDDLGSVSLVMTASEFTQFKRTHRLAEINNEETFKFKNQEFLTAYAKYLIEFWSK